MRVMRKTILLKVSLRKMNMSLKMMKMNKKNNNRNNQQHNKKVFDFINGPCEKRMKILIICYHISSESSPARGKKRKHEDGVEPGN
jgi:predicted protein tyrosine phosphatase